MIRVVLADDHELVRAGMAKTLATAGDIQIVAEAGDGRAALNALNDHKDVDVLVLDLSLPKVSGVEVLRRSRETHPFTQVLVVSMYPEEQYAPRLIEMGAAGYISKSRPAWEVLQAIRVVAGGGKCFDANIVSATKAPHEQLSAREYQVFVLILQGRSISEIAAELDLNSSTVSNHVTAIRTKLGANTVGDIVKYAAREGLIDMPAMTLRRKPPE
jgi:DNA-binding NarL/FixJ family response regulator